MSHYKEAACLLDVFVFINVCSFSWDTVLRVFTLDHR